MPDIPQLSNVAISLKNGVAILKYDRPRAGNALNVPMIQVRFCVRQRQKVLLFLYSRSSGYSIRA